MAKKQIKKRKPSTIHVFCKITYLIGGMFVISILAYALYSVFLFQNSEEEHTGFFICNKEKTVCELSRHIHADIDMTVCGEKIDFPKEKGNTTALHTHKEKNKIHWHARLRVDPKTQEPIDNTPLRLQSFLKQMEYTLPAMCPTNPNPKLFVMVNYKEVKEKLEYAWKDGDKIVVEFQ